MSSVKPQQVKQNVGPQSARFALSQSPLCSTVISLAVAIIALSISGLLAVTTDHIAFSYIIPALFIVTITLLAILLKQIR